MEAPIVRRLTLSLLVRLPQPAFTHIRRSVPARWSLTPVNGGADLGTLLSARYHHVLVVDAIDPLCGDGTVEGAIHAVRDLTRKQGLPLVLCLTEGSAALSVILSLRERHVQVEALIAHPDISDAAEVQRRIIDAALSSISNQCMIAISCCCRRLDSRIAVLVVDILRHPESYPLTDARSGSASLYSLIG